MFDQIFGNYLVNSNVLTKAELETVIRAEKDAYVKLGLIAVTEHLMTNEQVEEVNTLQAIMDKRFGEIAVEKGYLEKEQISRLLKKQGNNYMLFVQTLTDMGYMTLGEVEEELVNYQKKFGYINSDMDDLVSGDIDRTIKFFLPDTNEYCNKICGLAIRTIIRLIDSEAYVGKAYLVDEVNSDNCAVQQLLGDSEICSGFVGRTDSLLELASIFGQEEFETMDLDALDSVGEFVNCINGMFAAEMSCQNVQLDMLPPEFYDTPISITGNQFCMFPIFIKGNPVHFILSIDDKLTITRESLDEV